jgi:putative SOS response-associated peptidase YedK
MQALLAPYPAAEMEAYPVSTLVNSPANDRAECTLPA